MKKNCISFVLLLNASIVFSATKVELESDKSVTAEISENKEKQLFSISLSFVPVTSLDTVTNDEMTEVLSHFFAEEALSSYLKSPKMISFFRTKCFVHTKTEKQIMLTYEIPATAISDSKTEKLSVSEETIKKYIASVSSDTMLQDFRSTCFHDLRIAEAVFWGELDKKDTDKKELSSKIKKAFSELKRKIKDDDALFLSEKAELIAKADKVCNFLLSKANIEEKGETLTEGNRKNRDSTSDFCVSISPFEQFLLSDKNLLTFGGCRTFETSDGNIFLITVGFARVMNDSPEERIEMIEKAEMNAYGELAKYVNSSTTHFAAQFKSISEEPTSDGKRNVSLKKQKKMRTATYSNTYINNLPTIGTWYSKDKKFFFLAKGKMIKQKYNVTK